MKIKLISTFSDAGYHDYAKTFVESCFKHIKDIDVVIYKDTIQVENKENVLFLNLEESCHNLVKFKKRNAHRTFKKFRPDGVWFAHKVFATIYASRENDLDYLIWLVADTEIYDTVDPEYFFERGSIPGEISRVLFFSHRTPIIVEPNKNTNENNCKDCYNFGELVVLCLGPWFVA